MQAEQIAALTTLTYMVRAMIVMSSAQKKRMLAFGWDEIESPGGLILTCLEAVCRTYESDRSASASLLRRSLEAEHLAAHGYQEMPFLVRETERLIPNAPELVEDLYRALLGHDEQSDESVPLGQSLIMPMRSNRRQDFQLAVHNLGEMFRAFAEAAPVNATGAVFAAVTAKILPYARIPVEEFPAVAIQLGEATAGLAADGSHLWDYGGQHRYDTPLRMLDEFESMLVRLAQDPSRATVLRAVLDRVISECRFAAIWRRILRAGASAPNTLGMELRTLILSAEVLTSDETCEPAGELLHALFPLLNPREREHVEGTILAIPRGLEGDELVRASRHRDRLLGCLAPDQLLTETAKKRVEALQSSNGAPPNDPPLWMGEVYHEEYTVRDNLRDQGVRVDDEANRGIIDLGNIAGEFETQFSIQIPSEDDVEEVLPNLQSLHLALCSQPAGVDANVTDSVALQLTGACAVVARVGWLSEAADLASFLRTVFLEFAVGEAGEPDPAVSEQFDQCQASCPSARWHAAVGLCRLASLPAFADREVLGAIAHLSRDPVPSVRMAIAEGLGFVLRNAAEAATEILVRLCREERSLAVVCKALVGGQGLARNHPEILEPLVADAFARAGRDDPVRHVAQALRQVCLGLSLAMNRTAEEPYAGPIAAVVLADVIGNDDLAAQLVFDASAHLLDGALDDANARNSMRRLKSIELLTCLAGDLAIERQRLNQRWIEKDGWAEEERRRVEVLQRLAYQIGLRVQSSLEGVGANRPASGDKDHVRSRAIAARFLDEGSALLDKLLTIPFANVVHSVLQGLEHLVECDPGRVLLRIRAAVRAGKQGAYEQESLGIDLIARIVRRFFADFRRPLKEDIACRDALVEILDVFVRVGWPQAMELTFRLDEIFR
jgi:hypothetical protein